MTGTVLQGAVDLHLPSQSPPFGDFQYVNYRSQLQQATARAQSCLPDKSREAIIAFGYPYNGRRAFAKHFSNNMHSSGFHVLWLDIAALVTAQEGAMKDAAEQAGEVLSSASKRPLLFVVNNLDLLDVGQRENEALKLIQDNLSPSVIDKSPPSLVMLATAKSPGAAHDELKAFDAPLLLHFDWPSHDEAVGLLNLLEVPDHEEVVRLLFEFTDKMGIRYTAGSLINASKQAMCVAGRSRPDLGPSKAEDIVQAIRSFCSPTPVDEVQQYRAENRQYIEAARKAAGQPPLAL